METTTVILTITRFVFQFLKEDESSNLRTENYQRAIKSEMEIAHDILITIDQEFNRDLALNRVLSHLESAYGLLTHSFDGFTAQNTICYHIATIHKCIGSSQSLINKWLIDKADYRGDFNEEIENYKSILGDSYEIFKVECLDAHKEHLDDLERSREEAERNENDASFRYARNG